MSTQLFGSILSWLVVAAFGGVALATVREWWRHREPGRGYLALAIALLGVVALLAQVGQGQLVSAITVLLFLAAGYALLAFRHVLIPLRRGALRTAVAVGVLTAVVAPFELSRQQPAGFDPVYVAGAVLFVAVWCTYVGEPVVRFWIAARRLPSVQRARLRMLSAGYAGVVLVLVGSFATSLVHAGPIANALLSGLPLVILPFLAAGFAPPVWLRRIWRADEEEAFTRATQELMLRSPSPGALAAGGLDWAIRLVGGERGYLVGAEGILLARQGMTDDDARRLRDTFQARPRAGIVRSDTGQAILRVPLQLEGGLGALVVLAGAFTPVFGTDELTRLVQFGAALGIALDREKLAEAVRLNAEEVERLNHNLEARVAERTRELREAGSRTATILESVADAIVTVDPAGRIVSFNRAAEAIFERTPAEALGLDIRDLTAEPSRADMSSQVAAALAQGGNGHDDWRETTGLRGGGETFPLEFRLSRVEAGGEHLLVACMRDISERREYLAQLEYQALHDSLTGLPNRALFNDRIQQAASSGRRAGRSISVVLIDLDHFKEVNDTLGHGAGDTLLQRVADRLTAKVRASDTIARLGGDEFAVLLATTGRDSDLAIARKLIGSLREPFLIEGRRIHVSASAGVARHSDEGPEVEALLRHADVAMYVAKRERSGCVLYAADQDSANPLRLALQGDLHRAISQDELELHFQPIVDMPGSDLAAVEALVRWRHPEHGLLGPDRFIPAAEDTDLIHDLTAWVLGQALDAAARLASAGRAIVVAVNISPRSLTHPGLPRLVMQHLKRSGVDPGRLRLEVTETAAMAGLHGSHLKRLQRMGVSLSIDDFGTGHSSLARLRELPVSELKVDRSFVLDMATPGGNNAIVRSTIELAHGLDLRVVAEGVETEELWDHLLDLGCDFAQGYLVAKPMPLPELLAWSGNREEADAGDLVSA